MAGDVASLDHEIQKLKGTISTIQTFGPDLDKKKQADRDAHLAALRERLAVMEHDREKMVGGKPPKV